MNDSSLDFLGLSLITLAAILLVWAFLIAYNDGNALAGIFLLIGGWVLVNCLHVFVKGAKA